MLRFVTPYSPLLPLRQARGRLQEGELGAGSAVLEKLEVITSTERQSSHVVTNDKHRYCIIRWKNDRTFQAFSPVDEVVPLLPNKDAAGFAHDAVECLPADR